MSDAICAMYWEGFAQLIQQMVAAGSVPSPTLMLCYPCIPNSSLMQDTDRLFVASSLFMGKGSTAYSTRHEARCFLAAGWTTLC